MLNIRGYTVGMVQENCYIAVNDQKEALIFDPGDAGEQLVKEIKKMNVKPLAILLTHAHFDHIGGVDAIRDAFDLPVYVHEKEAAWLQNPALNGSGKYQEIPDVVAKEADHLLRKETELQLGAFQLELRYTPGHSPGSISYVFKEDRIAIVGDTLFKGSIGRTDLIGGSMDVLMKSIRNELLSLPKDTIIYPGHGELSTIEEEIQTNPFLNGYE